jgi:hypothetical protein
MMRTFPTFLLVLIALLLVVLLIRDLSHDRQEHQLIQASPQELSGNAVPPPAAALPGSNGSQGYGRVAPHLPVQTAPNPAVQVKTAPVEATETVQVAHGDILNPADGNCYVKVFHGQVRGFGSGIYRIETVTGTPEEIQQRV